MEKDLGLLRCSKLNCYAEFNKMVHSLAHCKRLTVHTMPRAKKMHGTPAEYTFYTTLLTMLQQVVSNNDASSQKQELQRVYEWFGLNKPLLREQKEVSGKQRPKLAFSSLSNTSMSSSVSIDRPLPPERPQTAPASFHESSRNSVPGNRTESQPIMTFTSAYVSRSLGHSLDLIGKTFEQLESVTSAEEKRPPSEGTQPSRSCPNTAAKSPVHISTQAHPAPNFLTNYTPPGYGGVQSHMAESVCFGEVFTLSPPVAARMILNRRLLPEDSQERELSFLRRRLHRSNARRPPKMFAHQFVVVNSQTKLPDTRDMQSYSDTVLAIAPPPSSPTGLPGAQHTSSKTMTTTAERGREALETIAETDHEMSSSLLAGGGTVSLSNQRVTPPVERGVGTERQNEGVQRSEDSSLDLRQMFPYEPRVSISSNVMSVSSPSSHAKPMSPARYPSVVSLTFPTDQEQVSGLAKRTARKLKKAPSPSSIKNKRNTRPRTVPAMKIQSYTL